MIEETAEMREETTEDLKIYFKHIHKCHECGIIYGSDYDTDDGLCPKCEYAYELEHKPKEETENAKERRRNEENRQRRARQES